jgi:hypothetical protein
VDASLLFRAYGMPGNGGGRQEPADVGLSFAPGRFPDGLVRLRPSRSGTSMGGLVETLGETLLMPPGPQSPN